MKFIYALMFASLLVFPAEAQRKKKKENDGIPPATTAAERWQGYQRRLKLRQNSLVKNIPFRNVGPTIMSGRVVDLEVNPNDPTHFYVAYASGSLWETTNNGTSFTPRFDNEIVMTLGDIAVDWKNKIIYAGTGENNSSRSSYSGYGLFKSADNGESWTHLGLEETHHIGRIRIHPDDPNILWVGAIGHLYSENPERGIYKSTDGGQTWNKVLFVDNNTGVIDLALQPGNPDLLLAASWERVRKAWNFQESGLGTAIYRSRDGGDTWKEIADDSGFPDTEGTGRIGLDFSLSNPNIVYAFLDNYDRKPKEAPETDTGLTKDALRNMTAAEFLALPNADINDFLDEFKFENTFNAVDLKAAIKKETIKPKDLVMYVEDANSLLFDTPIKGGEMYRSDDAGITWQKTHEGYIEQMINTYGYYFGQVRVDPSNSDIVYTMGVPLIRSTDAGAAWKSISKENTHADHHALWINPTNGKHMILGNDGGINITYDGGENWIACNSPAVGQFYAINVDLAVPYNVYGGLQDNGTWKGSSNYAYSPKWQSEGKYPYEKILGGDGMQVAVDTRDNKTVYIGYQYGNYFRVNTETGTRKYITPKHNLGQSPLRWNWEAPIMVSSHNQDIVYFGSNHFHRSMNQGETFQALSPDLTKGGKKGDVSFGTLTTIHESPIRFGLIYTGSDDGLIHVSKDAGQTWTRISDGLPRHFWISQVYASSFAEGRVYASLNGYRWDHFEPLIYTSDDYGKTWTNISSNLPAEPVNVVKEDPENENLIYVGTDHGLYASLDRGQSYQAFDGNLPAVAVHDLVVHPREKELVVGTHGRSVYIGNIAHLQAMNNELLAKELHVFPVDSMTYSNKWGSQTRYWGGTEIHPELKIGFYSKASGIGEIEIRYKKQAVQAVAFAADAGLNYVDVPLETDEAFRDLIDKEAKESYKIGENGNYYLIAGKYEVKVTIGEASQSGAFEIKAPMEKLKRKE